ncbi:MAG: hypothetical protein OWU84_00015 [Firmicutes bacterium]|nr:hypothetical protein [Bacillota bacterium]
MAEIMFGLGTSHSPQLSVPPEGWFVIAERDKVNPHVPYDALIASDVPKRMEGLLTLEVFREKHANCQRAIDELALALRQAEPDVMIIMGDDQEELWLDDGRPAIAVFRGSTLYDRPVPPEQDPPAYRPAHWAVHGEVEEPYPAVPALADHLIQSLMDRHFDVSIFSEQHPERTLSHAFTFVRRRIMRDRLIPMIPIMINTYYPPNQVRAARAWALGEAIGEAIKSWPDPVRVAVAASGGLSHFVIDEELDHQVIDAIMNRDAESLKSIPLEKLQAGSSEICNWIAAAGALQELTPSLVNYVPTYRSPAGTGVGMTFMQWQPA